MAFEDLRDWIDDLEERRSASASAPKSIGTKSSARSRGKFRVNPVRLCYSKTSKIISNTFCRRLFTNGTGTRERVCRFIGVPETTSYRDMVPIFKERFSRPVKPVTVGEGPVKENILRGADVDL